MKDFIIGVLVLILIINTIFIMCCAKISSEIEDEEYSKKVKKKNKE